jgi:hypothetical protein
MKVIAALLQQRSLFFSCFLRHNSINSASIRNLPRAQNGRTKIRLVFHNRSLTLK